MVYYSIKYVNYIQNINNLTPGLSFLLKNYYITQQSSGFYTFTPLGVILLNSIKNFITNEMKEIGGQEYHLPTIISTNLLKLSKRLTDFPKELFLLHVLFYYL